MVLIDLSYQFLKMVMVREVILDYGVTNRGGKGIMEL